MSDRAQADYSYPFALLRGPGAVVESRDERKEVV